MIKNLIKFFVYLFALTAALNAFAVDLEINTPGVNAIKQSMQARHAQLAPYYASGAVGIASDGMIALRDAGAVPLPQRQAVNGLVAAENQDRQAMYREIARANGHPEWEEQIRATFAQRWVQKAAPGWWYQNNAGVWVKK